MSVPETPTVMQGIVDNAEEKELWIVGREFERPPYFHAGKGGDTRLTRALRLCTDEKISKNSDGSYTVLGSEGRVYRVADSCSCPNSQKTSSKWCYHAVGVALYVEWQRRLRPMAPVVLGTLIPGTLPLPPTTVDERLATVPQGIAPTTPQEALMHEDDSLYIPEPESAPAAILGAPEPMPPAPVKIPREFTVNIKGRTHVLYTGLVLAANAHGLLTLAADWTYNDAELSLAHAVATFRDGRRYEESGDASPGNVSKGMGPSFRRVALTRAKARCLRDALGISECSADELADEEEDKPPVPYMGATKPAELGIRTRIWRQVQSLDATMRSREQVEAFIEKRTGMKLHPDLYQAIETRLKDIR